METLVRLKGEGVVTVPREAILTFPEGLVGLESWHRFVLLEYEDDPVVGLLQSLDDRDICLFVTDPRNVCPDYSYQLSPGERAALQLQEDGEVLTLCIMAARQEPFELSVNLLGPLAINPRRRLGKQVILAGSAYPARFVLSKAKEDASC
ncbi:MAG: flagellar assembly protein FliW [Chloroflexi bacterium]|nr:flagellar assembly protein FliW [Chloroflexota bacterium]